jgi:hypothetical protein
LKWNAKEEDIGRPQGAAIIYSWNTEERKDKERREEQKNRGNENKKR